jgi:protein TonB
MSTYAPNSSSFSTGRATVFVLIVGLHLLLGWAFVSGFAVKVAKLVAPDVIAKIIEEPKPKEQPPPPPPVQLQERPPVQIIDPLVNITVPADVIPPVAVTTTQPVAPPAPRAVVTAPGTPMQITYAPNTDDLYPSMSKQLNEEGRPEIRFCFLANGKTTTELTKSSGFDRLDQAAVKYGNMMRGKPAVTEGHAVDSCKNLAVKFVIKK